MVPRGLRLFFVGVDRLIGRLYLLYLQVDDFPVPAEPFVALLSGEIPS